jgi:hypothetical protein
MVGPRPQWPAPSQMSAPVTAAPSQVPPWHIVPSGYLRQAPAPSHLPSRPQVLADDTAQSEASRALEPLVRATHVPSDPVRAQVRQPLLQLSLQQNPSTQKLLAHSDAHVHDCPFAFWAPPPSGLPQAAASLEVGSSGGWSVVGRTSVIAPPSRPAVAEVSPPASAWPLCPWPPQPTAKSDTSKTAAAVRHSEPRPELERRSGPNTMLVNNLHMTQPRPTVRLLTSLTVGE